MKVLKRLFLAVLVVFSVCFIKVGAMSGDEMINVFKSQLLPHIKSGNLQGFKSFFSQRVSGNKKWQEEFLQLDVFHEDRSDDDRGSFTILTFVIFIKKYDNRKLYFGAALADKRIYKSSI